MVLITPQLKKKFRGLFRAARKEKIRVLWLEPDLVYVARRAKGHGRYLVKVIATPSVKGDYQIWMKCGEINGGPCQGYQFKGFCSHLASVVLRVESKPNGRRQAEAA